MNKIQATVDTQAPGKPLHHFWEVCVGAGRANEGLRAGWLEQLKLVHEECGFRYCRFHGLFHDDMFVYRLNESGHPIYNFQYVDELFDRMLAIGVRPFVEFGFCPSDLATQTATVFWWKGNGSPPKDYLRWGELIDHMVRHWVHRYGLDEVRRWYFEVWNEPNLHPFFKGTKTDYFELYRVTVQTVKAIDRQLRVGGPATSNFVPDDRFAGETEDISQHQKVVANQNSVVLLDAMEWRPVWVKDFLAFCQREHLSVDFISCHPYPTDWALDARGETVKSTRGVSATPTDLQLLRRVVNNSPYPNAQIHLTEWNSSPSPRDFTHDYLQAATFVIRANLESIGLVDSLSYWTFTDVFEENGAGDAAFHGGFGMINYRGIPKPAFHAYRFLHRLGDEVVEQKPGFVLTRCRATGRIVALAYHYPPEISQTIPASFDTPHVAEQTLITGQPLDLGIVLHRLPPHSIISIESLDGEHGNPIATWTKMGKPASPTAAQMQILHKAARLQHAVHAADGDGTFAYQASLQPWTVLLIEQIQHD